MINQANVKGIIDWMWSINRSTTVFIAVCLKGNQLSSIEWPIKNLFFTGRSSNGEDVDSPLETVNFG